MKKKLYNLFFLLPLFFLLLFPVWNNSEESVIWFYEKNNSINNIEKGISESKQDNIIKKDNNLNEKKELYEYDIMEEWKSREINEVIVHHTLWNINYKLERSLEIINKFHKKKFKEQKVSCKWYNISYHYVIAWDWSYEKTRCEYEIWWHSSERNSNSIWIVLEANTWQEVPTEKQMNRLNDIINNLEKRYWDIVITPHREFNYWTTLACPGTRKFDWNSVIATKKFPEYRWTLFE